MPKILHTGDLHLDSAFALLSPGLAKERRQGLRRMFSRIIDIANEKCVDALIIAGDLFDAYPIYPETENEVIRSLARAEMPVLITPGNHDPYTASSPYRTLTFPENVHIFTENHLSPFEIPSKKLRFYGAAYTSESFSEPLLRDFRVENDDFTNVVILHGNVGFPGYVAVTPEEIGASGADYVALAHIHKPTELLRAGGTYYAYCGCAEARDFGEQYDTGVVILSMDDGKVSFSRVSVSDVRYREITVNAETSDILSALPEPHGHEALRLHIVGECDKPNLDDLRNTLSGRYFELEVYDETTPPRNLWEGIGEDNLRGLFLQKMRAMLDAAADEDEERKILLSVKYGIDAIENRDF